MNSATVVWPPAPRRWSFSAYRIARDCPRQWALMTAGAVTGAGAGGAGSMPPLVGRIRGRTCHRALEEMFRIHGTHGGPPVGSPAMLAFWRERLPRGLTALTREMLLAEVHTIATKEGLSAGAERNLARACEAELPMILRYVNGAFRVVLTMTSATAAQQLTPEVDVEATLGAGDTWVGRIDLVAEAPTAIALLDFKTGRPGESDQGQLECYALLYARDRRRNPEGRLATRLVLLYPQNGAVEWEAPSERGLDELERTFGEAGARLNAEVTMRPPRAQPEERRCTMCSVRGHCDDYWMQAREHWSVASHDRRVRVERLQGDREIHGRSVGTGLRVVLILRDDSWVAPPIGAVIRVVGAKSTGAPSDDEAAEVLEVSAPNLTIERAG